MQTLKFNVMYPGFKFGAGDHVVEVAKRAAEKIGRTPYLHKVVAEVMRTSSQDMVSQQLT